VKKPRKLPSLKTFLIPQLRRVYWKWPSKKQALAKARRVVDDGFYKNGNPKTKVLFECAHCAKLFDSKNVQVDHIIPVIDPINGFTTWDDYIDRLFCSVDNLQVLCTEDHDAKTELEQIVRNDNKKD